MNEGENGGDDLELQQRKKPKQERAAKGEKVAKGEKGEMVAKGEKGEKGEKVVARRTAAVHWAELQAAAEQLVLPCMSSFRILHWLIWDLGPKQDVHMTLLGNGLRNLLIQFEPIEQFVIEQQGALSVPERIVCNAIHAAVVAVSPETKVDIVSAASKLTRFGILKTESYDERKELAVQLVHRIMEDREDASAWTTWVDKQPTMPWAPWFKMANDMADSFLYAALNAVQHNSSTGKS